MANIPLLRPYFPSLSRAVPYLKKSLDANTLSNFGPLYVEAKERLDTEFKAHTLIVNSGTAAIRVAVQALCKRRSRVLVPDFTHIGTLQAVLAAGCIPVLAPVHRETWALDPAYAIGRAKDFDAFIVVAPFGYKIDHEIYLEMSKELGKPVIFDLAGAYPTKIPGARAVCYSLHATKNLAVGEGGFTVFANEADFVAAHAVANFQTQPDRSIASKHGDNLKVSEITCAYLLAALDEWKLKGFKRTLEKIELINKYASALQGYVLPPPINYDRGHPSLMVFGGLPAEALEKQTPGLGFVTKRYYLLLTTMPGLDDVDRIGRSSKAMETCLALPRDLEPTELTEVIDGLLGLLKSGPRIG